MTRHDEVAADDRRRVQRAAMRVGIWVGVASATIVAILTGVTVWVLLASSRPDEGGVPGDDGWVPGEGRVVDLDDILPVALVLGAVAVLLLGLIAWWAARRAARPLADALAAQRAFVADASHELRTPLTTLSSRIQLAEHRAERGGDVAEALAALRRDAAVMDEVLTDLLVTAEHAGSPGHSRDSADVARCARDAIALIDPRAAAAHVRLTADIPVDTTVAADRVALTRALAALVDNAVRFSPPGSSVDISARSDAHRVQIRVADQGGGIRGVDPQHLFDRFSRGQGNGDDRGFGLGLALVRDTATRFGGTVELERTSPSGTTFLIVLPARS